VTVRNLLLTLGLAAAFGSAFGQHAAQQPHAGSYAGLQAREIKALTAEQVADLREGRGMGASLPAELNGVPGPMHVLQLAQRLKVMPDQQAALERITADMKASAQQFGAQVIAAEAELDNAFRSGSIDEDGIRHATARIASLQGQLRAVHLSAHLQTKRLLSHEQIAVYNVARGYAPARDHSGRH
jgi:Spy/CpxP family protein refolding chaperone